MNNQLFVILHPLIRPRIHISQIQLLFTLQERASAPRPRNHSTMIMIRSLEGLRKIKFRIEFRSHVRNVLPVEQVA